MSAINGDKARFNREQKGKRARKARGKLLRKQMTPAPIVTPVVIPT
jgi:hypothetical protein